MYRTVADAALIEAAQRITLLVRACRDEGERERRLPAQVLAAMHEAWRHLRSVGGILARGSRARDLRRPRRRRCPRVAAERPRPPG